MLTLLSVPGTSGLRSFSPFACKAEALIALAGRDYATEYVADFSTLPYSKVPVLKDGDLAIPDSSLIQQHLEKHHGLASDSHLSAPENAVAEAFRRMAEEHLYWAMVYARWIDPAGETFMLDGLFGGVPEEARRQAFEGMREHIRQELHMHGLGRHKPEDIYAFGCADLDAIAAYLGDKPFFMGDRPASVDASLAGLLINILASDIDTALMRHARSIPALGNYVVRFEQMAFGPAAKIPALLEAEQPV